MITTFFTNLLSPPSLYYNSHYEKFADGTVKCIDEEIPFDIPESWSWERWGNLSQSIQYGYNAPALNQGDIRMVRISDIQNGDVLWESVPYCNINQDEIGTYLLQENDILFARTGGTVGKSFLVKETPYPAIYAGYLIRTRYSRLLSSQYMKYFMESNLYWTQLKDGTIATAQPNCNGKTLGKMILPIPPLSEQYRIVTRIDALMRSIAKYERSKIKLDILETELQPQLKKSILQYAIQGKLVTQNSDDEPASELLKRINEEKEQLIKAGKIKRDKNTSIIFKGDDNKYFEKKGDEVVCIDDEIPFEIPDSWEWVSLGSLLQIQTGASFKKEETKNNQIGVRILRGGNILPNKYTFKDDDIFIDKHLVSENILLKKDDLITPAVTSIENVGKMARILQNYDNVSAGGFVFILRLFVKSSTTAQYLCYAIQAPVITEKIKSITKKSGSAFYNIGKERLSAIKIPLPPFQEQKRIVNVLDNVLASIMRN